MRTYCLIICWLVACCGGAASPLSAQEAPQDLIAAHIRTQGYACDKPQSAKRDPRDSIPGEQAWVLTCDNASYRVRLIPDMAAIVERIR